MLQWQMQEFGMEEADLPTLLFFSLHFFSPSSGDGSGDKAVSRSPEFFYFRAQTGEIWCILGAIF